jgi:ATP-dependent Clp protease protease subunit
MARKNNSDDIFNLHEYGIYVPTRTVQFPFIEGDCDVSQASVNRVIANMHILESMDKTKPITFILNSYGGDMFQAFALYDYIRSLESVVNIHAIGACMSAATIILQAGDKRMISYNCTFMMHIGTSSYDDHSSNVRNWVKYEDKVLTPKMKDIYAYRIKRKAKESDNQLDKRIDTMLMHDHIFTAEQVVALGLADEIISVKTYSK